MKADNALSLTYMQDFSVQAARTLEQVADKDVAALFIELPAQVVAPVLSAMLPDKAASCLKSIKDAVVVTLLSEISVASAARIYQLLEESKQLAVINLFRDKKRKQLLRHLQYPSLSVGAMLDVQVDVLPMTITVADASRRIEHLEHPVKCEIYIVNDAYQLQGVLELGRLLTANHHALVREIMNRKAQPVSVHAMADSLVNHPGWKKWKRLPVIERDNTLLGVLEYSRLQEVYGESGAVSPIDPVENILSLTHLYWISLVQFIDSLFGQATAVTSAEKGGENER